MRNHYSRLLYLCLMLAMAGSAFAQTTFTGSRGFAPTFKTLQDTPAPGADLSIQVPGHVELNGCVSFVYTGVAGGACLCADESLDQIYHDTDCSGTFTSGDFYLSGDGTGIAVYHLNNASPTNPLRLSRGGDDEARIYVDDDGNSTWDPLCNNDTCNLGWRIWEDRTLTIFDGLTPALIIDPDNGTPNGKWQFQAGYYLLKSVEWKPGSMFGDGTECNSAPTDETINGEPDQGMRCPMTGSETDGTIFGSGITLPGDFVKSADVEFHVKAWLITDGGAGTWHGQIAIDCVGEGEQRGTYGTAVGLDLTPADADVVNDEIVDTAAAVNDTDTTGADCDPGDTLYWKFTSCDTDATPSAGCTSSAGQENKMSIFSIKMDYWSNSFSQ